MSGADEIMALAADFGKASFAVGKAMHEVYKTSADDFADDWSDNARATSGAHGVHYPDSITAEMKMALGGVAAEIGPETGRKQGSMGRGFEYGSRNQPPHLDGARALPAAEARLARGADTAIGHLIP